MVIGAGKALEGEGGGVGSKGIVIGKVQPLANGTVDESVVIEGGAIAMVKIGASMYCERLSGEVIRVWRVCGSELEGVNIWGTIRDGEWDAISKRVVVECTSGGDCEKWVGRVETKTLNEVEFLIIKALVGAMVEDSIEELVCAVRIVST